MKAITSTGNTLNSSMDMRFAKCSYFCFLKEKDYEFVSNPFLEQEGHIAPDVVNWLKEKGISQIITGEIGSQAHKSLKEAHIQAILIDSDKFSIQGILKKLGR